ncbi:MAG: M13 family metallopeptidase [Clostridiales bacterium]|jgi:predicted metalloendopeptidase|nr:M13 family metallopeptidase [Clostridiales bacterium]
MKLKKVRYKEMIAVMIAALMVYAGALIYTSRDSDTGIKSLQAHLSQIEAASDMKDFEDIQVIVTEAQDSYLFFGFSIVRDIRDSAINVIYFDLPAPLIPKDTAVDPYSAQNSALARYAEKLFTLAGYTDPAGSTMSVVSLNAYITSVSPDPDSPENGKDAGLYTMEDLQSMFPDISLERLLQAAALNPEPVYHSCAEETLRACAELYCLENLRDLKAYAAFQLINGSVGALDSDFRNARLEFESKLYQ